MISFNSKITTIGAVLLMIYLYYQYNKEQKKVSGGLVVPSYSMQGSSKGALYNFSIEDGKKYRDFNLYEKFMYNLYKDELPSNVRKAIEE